MATTTSNIAFLRPLLRGLPIIAAAMVCAVLVAKKYLKYATPMYESTAKIRLADTHEGYTNSNLYKDFDVFVNTNKIDAEVELLKSKVLVSKAIKDMQMETVVYRVGGLHKTELYNQSPFIIHAAITNNDWYEQPFAFTVSRDSVVELTTPDGVKVSGLVNKPITIKGAEVLISNNDTLLQQKPNLQVNDHYAFIIYTPEQAVDKVIGSLDIMSVDKEVPVLRISYKSPVPQKSADIVNNLSEAYIEDYIHEKCKSADTSEQFLTSQLKTYSSKLSSSENAIEQYRDAHNIINIRQETETDLRKIADLKKQLASVRMNLNAINTLKGYMNSGQDHLDHFLELAPNFEEFTDLLSTELVKKIKELQRDKKDLLVKYTPQNEKVKVVDDKLADISSYLEESINNTQKSLQIKYDDLQKSIGESEQVFNGLAGREKNMTILERNFGLNEQIYRTLHEKRTEAEIAKAAAISFHRIISPGEVPEKPVSPNTVIIKVMAAILGMFGGIFFIYGVHGIKARVNNEDTINRLSGTPVNALIPYLKKESQSATFFRKWTLELELKQLIDKGTVITVTSFNKLEGKTFITEHLAQSLRLLDKKVLLINGDEVLKGELSNPSNWKKYIDLQKQEYDLLLIKNVPAALNAAAIVPMAAANRNFFVLDSRITKKNCVTEADLLQEQLQLPDMQFILNRAGYMPSLFKQVKNEIAGLFKRVRK